MKLKVYFFQGVLTLLLAISSSITLIGSVESGGFILHCPNDVYVSCTDELWDLSCYGNATYTYNNHNYSAGAPSVSFHLNSCNTGYITRTWQVQGYNWQWYSCTQTIYVSSGFYGDPVIIWPGNITLYGCNPSTDPYNLPQGNAFPTWYNNPCNLLGRSYSDQVYVTGTQCKFIKRTWTVVDWCNCNPYTGEGYYTYVQNINIINDVQPTIVCPDDVTAQSINCNDAYLSVPPIQVDASSCGGEFIVTNNSPYAISGGRDISGIYPAGLTKVTYTIKYGCGNIKTCTVKVHVKGEGAPTPKCLAIVSTSLMGVDSDGDGVFDQGMVEVSAKMFDHGSHSNCGYKPLKFSFSEDFYEPTRIFTCDDVGKNWLKMWVIDSAGEKDYCEVVLDVQNNVANIPNCQPGDDGDDNDNDDDDGIVDPQDSTYFITGNVLTLTDTPLKNAVIKAEYRDSLVRHFVVVDTVTTLVLDSIVNASGVLLYRYIEVEDIVIRLDSVVEAVSKTTLTNAAGNYQIDSLSFNNEILYVSGTYSDDPHQFIDDKDYKLLEKFLNGEIQYFNYYQYLSSDVNEDGVIDVEDYNILKAFVNGEIDALPGDNLWYLLDKNANFDSPEDVLTSDIPLRVQLDTLYEGQPAVDFIAIKKGNISVDPGSLQSEVVKTRVTDSDNQVVKAYPNPFTESVSFSVNSEVSQSAELRMFDVTGQLIYHREYDLQQGENKVTTRVKDGFEGLIIYQWTIADKTYKGKLTRVK